MQRTIWILLMVSVVFSCNSSKQSTENNSVLSTKEIKDGWQLLFDGKTTNGWHAYGNQPVSAAWKVANGELYFDTSVKVNYKTRAAGYLLTDDEFENYHFKIEWKISENGNSGIIFNVNENIAKYDWPFETGPEMQILHNEGHPDGKIPKHRAGDLYDLVACRKETVKGPGEWNSAEIILLNGKLDFFLNGENVVSTTMWDDNWNQMVAASKFKTMPDFGKFRKGRISLQDHGNNVWFRNIMIKRL